MIVGLGVFRIDLYCGPEQMGRVFIIALLIAPDPHIGDLYGICLRLVTTGNQYQHRHADQKQPLHASPCDPENERIQDLDQATALGRWELPGSNPFHHTLFHVAITQRAAGDPHVDHPA